MADQRPQWVLIDLTMSPPPSNVLSTDMTPIVKSEMTVDPPPSTASSHTSSRSTIVNPYAAVAQRQAANKFIGGAERARLEARKKKKPTRILRPGEEQKQSDSVLSKKINILERFFAALLRSSAADFLKASEGSADAAQLWTKICHRVSLDVPTQAIQAVYEDAATHFEVRAALVLEEARHAISQSLQAAWRQRRQSPMFLTAHLTEKSNAHGHVKITFSSRNNFTIQELHHIRPGAIFQCISRDEQSIVQNAVLGVVVTGNREQVEKKKCFTCLFFRCDDLPVRIDDCEFAVTAITQLVTELRCFEAMTHQPASISFLHQLLGKKGSTHTHFEDGEEFIKFNQGGARNSWKENSKDKKAADTAKSLPLAQDFFLPRVKPEKPAKPTYFHLPPLNKAQEDAATAYLRSEQNTITLVQGPPGTGKTTLLVSIICRYLMESMENGKEYRLLVSAPTNKAISVLATRFLAAMSQDCPVPCNAIMVGDAEKLLVDERSSGSSETQNLKSIFLYSWIPNVIEGYKRIKSYFLPRYSGTETVPTLLQLALQLQARLTNSLPYLSADILDWTGKIVTALDTRKSGGAAHDIVSIIEKLLKELKEMPSDAVWTQLLLSANVIFCTLASAGGTVLKKTSRINDLIVDEAAAASEPELCIPFHLKPTRLLAVGDPLQLPATVLSRKAIDLGLTKSLHERLMYECDFKHVMLNVQYRMSVQISSFPSSRFYDSKIGNGSNVSSAQYQNGARLLDQLPYIFLQVEGLEEQSFGGSYCNRIEAQKIVELVLKIQDTAHSSEQCSWNGAERIRVITFYQAQVTLIKRFLQERGLGNKIVVATVDSSQGCEADIVLISFVRSQSEREARHTAGFLTDDRRMNVALTRAKYQLICVGNVRNFRRMVGAETLQLLATDAETRGLVRTPFSTVEDVDSRRDIFYGGRQGPQQPQCKKFRSR